MVGRMISPSHARRRFLRLAGAAAAAAMSSRAFGAEQQTQGLRPVSPLARNLLLRRRPRINELAGTAINSAGHSLAEYNRSDNYWASTKEISPEGGLFMAEVTIEARPNGPYVVTGTIELRDTNGNVLPTQARTVLCRCGASTKKPFCDGTHSKMGFQAAAQAVPDSAEKS